MTEETSARFKTLRHIETVRNMLNSVITELLHRQEQHDPGGDREREAHPAGSGLGLLLHALREDRDEDDVVDSQDDLEDRQGQKRNPRLGTGDQLHAGGDSWRVRLPTGFVGTGRTRYLIGRCRPKSVPVRSRRARSAGSSSGLGVE